MGGRQAGHSRAPCSDTRPLPAAARLWLSPHFSEMRGSLKPMLLNVPKCLNICPELNGVGNRKLLITTGLMFCHRTIQNLFKKLVKRII